MGKLKRLWLRVRSGGRIRIGARADLDRGAIFDLRHSGRIETGRRLRVGHGAILAPHGGHIRLGDHVSVNPYAILYGHGGLTIGNDVRIAAHVVIVPSNHNFQDPDRPIRLQGATALGIEIGDDVWIGSHAVILDGAVIERGAVIAAGAVVRGRVPANTVVGGVPARRIGQRGPAPAGNG